jgi:hypothetical protein
MKSNRINVLVLLSLPIAFILGTMARMEPAPQTFRPNSAPKQISDFINPSETITIDKVPYMDLMRMMAKYRDERQAIINNHFRGTGPGKYGEDFEDSRYYYVSLQTMERYIAYIRQQIAANNLTVQFSGIRIYPIVYPNTGSNAYFSSIPSIYRNHQSLVFAATYMNEEGYAVDFDPDVYMANPGGSGNVPRSLDKPDSISVATFLSTTFGGNLNGHYSAQDHTWLCPPPLCVHAAGLSNSDKICPDSNSCPY